MHRATGLDMRVATACRVAASFLETLWMVCETLSYKAVTSRHHVRQHSRRWWGFILLPPVQQTRPVGVLPAIEIEQITSTRHSATGHYGPLHWSI